MRVSHSMTQTWRRCRHKFYLHYIEGWRAKHKARGLALGSMGHMALAEWYSSFDAAKALAVAEKESEDPEGEDFQLLKLVLERYFAWDLLQGDISGELSHGITELEFNIPIGLGHTIYGFIDRVFERLDKTLWVMEHKFNKSASVQHLALDPQISIYIAAARRLGYAVNGVLFNVIRMSDGPTARKEPALRDFAFRSELQGEAILEDLGIQAEEILEFTLLNPILQARKAYRNPTKDCSWDCPFYRACQIAMEGEDPLYILENDCERSGADPYKILRDPKPVEEVVE